MYARPYIVGIAGNSGSGKSTIANAIADIFTHHNAIVLCGDDMHRWERNDINWQRYTHLDPEANDLELELALIGRLDQGQQIMRRIYDHHTGTFLDPKLIKPKNLIIFEGLHTFFLEKMRKIYKMRIFIKPNPELNQNWKLQRDTKERSKDKSKILEEIKNRERDFKSYVEIQEQYADIKIEFVYYDNQDKQKIDNPSFYMIMSLSNQSNLDGIIKITSSIPQLKIDYFCQDDFQTIKAYGTVASEEVKGLAQKILPELNMFANIAPCWHSGYIGIIQIVISYLLLRNGLKL